MSELYKKDLYLDKSIEYLISREIIEYDIQSAGYNISKKFKLLSESKLNHLETLDKKQRQVALGLYQKTDSEFKEALKEKFIEARKLFFEANNIQDNEVLSIKRDAVVMLRRCNSLVFDDIIFRDKHVYTSYYKFGKMEFYLESDHIDVKGINDDKLYLHKDYMLDFLFKILKMMEISSSRKQTISNLNEFVFYYKNKELDFGYYRELNSDSLFRLKKTLGAHLIGLEHIKSLDDIDISYNYMKYIVPIINILL